jgi:hypothetical protein
MNSDAERRAYSAASDALARRDEIAFTHAGAGQIFETLRRFVAARFREIRS